MNFRTVAIRVFIFSLAFLTAPVQADEIQCLFDGEQGIEFEQIDHDGGGSSIEFLLPRSQSGRLHRVDLRYGKELELFVQVHFEEEDQGYRVSLMLERVHQPLELLGIYHHGGCFSVLKSKVKKTNVSVSKDRV